MVLWYSRFYCFQWDASGILAEILGQKPQLIKHLRCFKRANQRLQSRVALGTGIEKRIAECGWAPAILAHRNLKQNRISAIPESRAVET